MSNKKLKSLLKGEAMKKDEGLINQSKKQEQEYKKKFSGVFLTHIKRMLKSRPPELDQ